MKQTLFLLPKDDSRNSADKQTHKKKATLCLCLFLCTGVPDSKMRLAKKEMMNINNRKRHLFRKAYADMYIKKEKYLQKEDCFPAPPLLVVFRR